MMPRMTLFRIFSVSPSFISVAANDNACSPDIVIWFRKISSKQVAPRFYSIVFQITIKNRNSFWKGSVFALGLAVSTVTFQAAYAPAFSATPASLDDGFRHMYNLDFPAAHKSFENFKALHPDDPLGPAANAAAYLFAEFDRLHVLEFDLFTDGRRTEKFDNLSLDPAIKVAFEGELARVDEIAAKVLAQSSNDPNALFAKILADGLRADYAGLVEKRKLNALDFLKSSRSNAEKLIALDPGYGDAYLAIGIENYVLGMRSAPTRWVLRLKGAQTNKEKGIENLRITAEKGKYLAPYARVLLTIAYLREEDRSAAKKLLTSLVHDFPNNYRYRDQLARLHS
jgi:hypothetical protein